MKKKILLLSLIGILLLTGCGEKQEIEHLRQEITQLENTKAELQSSINDLKNQETIEKIRTGTERYIVVIRIEQQHLTLDLEEHIKDSMNALEIPIPVDEEFYNSVNNGTVLDNSFRSGSFFMKGSWGNWKISIVNKYID